MNKEIKKIEKEIKTLRDHCKKEFEVAIQKLLNFKKCCKMHIFLVTICNTFECENVFQILYLICRYLMRMNLAQSLRNMSSSHATYLTRSSHYSVIGALVGTLTGLGLIINKQKVLKC